MEKTMLKLTPVSSSNIKAVGYNKELNEIYVMFMNGGLYSYSALDGSSVESLYEGFWSSLSVGKYFMSRVRNNKDLKFVSLDPKEVDIEIKTENEHIIQIKRLIRNKEIQVDHDKKHCHNGSNTFYVERGKGYIEACNEIISLLEGE